MDQMNATPADAKLILKLYDLRRESVMRQARAFMASFMPKSADDVMKLAYAYGTAENAYFRQVVGYWEMAASLALHGAVHEGLFLDNAGEMFFTYAKFAPYLAELRSKLGSAEFLGKCEAFITRTPESQARLQAMIERQKKMAERMAQAGK